MHVLTLKTVCLDPVIFRVLWSLATVFAISATEICVGGEGYVCVCVCVRGEGVTGCGEVTEASYVLCSCLVSLRTPV